MNNISAVGNERCTGCGVCSVECPKDAIKIKLNEKGFFEAEVNENMCVNCGKCKTVCYKFFDDFSKNDQLFNINKSTTYAAYSNDHSVRYKSSSGGIGTEIAKYGIENNYSICGVKYNYKLNRAEHMITNSLNDLQLIMGSKYIQSYTYEAFKKLSKDKKYIVFGTPCQIYGLRKYMLNNNISNIILVDFFCHGIPSYKLWKKYLRYISSRVNIKEVKNISFRDKTFGWHNFSMNIQDNSKRYIKIKDKDKFLRFFLGNFCLNKPCYNCKLRFNKIYSDIRLGDFWGPMCKEDEIGSSIVLANSEIGLKVLKDLNDRMYLKQVAFEDLKTSQYVPKMHEPSNYEEFNNQLSSNISLQVLYYKYLFRIDIKIFIKKSISKIFPSILKNYIKSKKN